MSGFCVLAALICLGPSVSRELFYDDAVLIGQDARFLGNIDWSGLWARPYWGEQLWRPLTLTVIGFQLAISRELGLASPALLMHLTSLLLYAVCVFAFTWILYQITKNSVAALIAGLFFAVHPVHLEAVATVVGQAEVLVGLAACAAILILERSRSRTHSHWHLVALVAVVAAAMMSKEQGFVLPLIIATYLYLLPSGQMIRETTTRWMLYPFVLAVGLWLVRSSVLYSGIGATPAESLDSLRLADRLLVALGMLPQVAALLVFPVRLAQEYTPPAVPVGTGFTGAHLAGLAIVVGTISALVWSRRRNPVVALGILWMVVAWLPVSSILATTGILIAERTLFLPSMGVAIVLAGILTQLAVTPRSRTLILGLASAPILLLGWLTISRSEVWIDEESFFSAMTRDQPRGYRAWFIRGRYELTQGNPRGAAALYRQAVSLWPESANAAEDLGGLLRQRGDCDSAIPMLGRSLESNQSRTRLRAILVECLLTVGDTTQARRTAMQGLRAGDSSFTKLLDRMDRR